MIIPGTTYAGRALNLIGDLDAPELMTIEEVAGNVLIDGIDEPSGSVFAPLLREITSSTIALAELELSGDLSLVGSTIALEKPLRCRNLQLHNSTLTQRATNLVRDFALRVEAETIVVAADSTVDVSGKGYLPGRTVGNIAPPNAVYFGGSYGGLGASYPTVDAVMPTYGSFARPEHLGSGSGQVDGGSGGGLVTIVADSLFLDGTILANGDAGPNKKSGGSGGGILVEVGELRGEGSLQAIGGEVRFYDHYNGGGGRIAVYYDSSADFSGTFSAHGGLAYNWHGGAGTVYVQDRAEPYGTLIVDNHGGTPNKPWSTPLPSVGSGFSTTLGATTLMNSAVSFPTSLIGLRLNPNTAQNSTFAILGNDAHTLLTDPEDGELTAVAAAGDVYAGVLVLKGLKVLGKAELATMDRVVIVPTEQPEQTGVNLAGRVRTPSLMLPGEILVGSSLNVEGQVVASELHTIRGAQSDVTLSDTATLVAPNLRSIEDSSFHLPRVEVAGNLTLTTTSLWLDAPVQSSVAGALTLAASSLWLEQGVQGGSLTLQDGSLLGLTPSTESLVHRLDLDLSGPVQIDSSSELRADGAGYRGGRTLQNQPITLDAAGSHGGVGGRGGAGEVMSTYGSFAEPLFPGSGAAHSERYSNMPGGGFIRIKAPSVVLEGLISADAAAEDIYQHCGGSGGAIVLEVGILSGAGLLRANGMSDLTACSDNNGGGGRIAVLAEDFSFTGGLEARGGKSNFPAGGAGTVFVKTSDHLYGELLVDNGGAEGWPTVLPAIGSGSIAGLAADRLEVTADLVPLSLMGLYVWPDISEPSDDTQLIRVVGNEAHALLTDPAVDLTLRAEVGDTYQGVVRLDVLTVRGGAVLQTEDWIVVDDLDVSGDGGVEAPNLEVPIYGMIHTPEVRFTRTDQPPGDFVAEVLYTERELWNYWFGPFDRKELMTVQVQESAEKAAWLSELEDEEPILVAALDLKTCPLTGKPVQPGDVIMGMDPVYQYDTLDRVTKVTDPLGFQQYSYHAQRGTLEEIFDSQNNALTSFSYDTLSRLTTITYPNGMICNYTYGLDHRLASIVYTLNDAVLDSFIYSYDEVGNISRIDRPGWAVAYSYDLNNQLIATEYEGNTTMPDEWYSYDAVGNRLSSHLSDTYVYDELNRLLEDDQHWYEWDDNGNLTLKGNKADGSFMTLTHDAENRLRRITKSDGTMIEYGYDARGRRVARSVNGMVERYHYSGNDVLFDTNEDPALTTRYINLPGAIDQKLYAVQHRFSHHE